MKILVALVIIFFHIGSRSAEACGSYSPEQQAKKNAAEKASLHTLCKDATSNADLIIIGTVSHLSRPNLQTGEFGTATFSIDETLKGHSLPNLTVQWKEKFIYSCQQSEMFHNVGFRLGGKFIIYLRDGQVFRSAAADYLRSGLLSLNDEKATASSGS